MNLWETVTGSDLTRQWRAFQARAAALPADYQAAWEQIKVCFTGRSLMPVLGSALRLLEETAADGLSIQEVLGDDIKGFCAALADGEGAGSYRDRWRRQLNQNVARKLSKLGG